MKHIDRRTFLKTAALAGAGTACTASTVAAPLVLTTPRTSRRRAQGTLIFKPYYVQRGVGPHLRWAYASDTKWDAFHSDIDAPENGAVTISDTEGQRLFGINTRWNVEGFGFIFLTADNRGAFYELPPEGETRTLNLNVELAKSRVLRNRCRMQQHTQNGWQPSRALQSFLDLSETYYEDAEKTPGDEERRAGGPFLSDISLNPY